MKESRHPVGRLQYRTVRHLDGSWCDASAPSLSPNEALKLGDEFCFQLDSEIAGHAVAFQLYERSLAPASAWSKR